MNDWKIRSIMVENQLMFIVNDLAEPLGLSRSRLRHKFREMDDDEKVVRKMHNLCGKQKTMMVTYPGLYSLILSCPKARQVGTGPYRFRRWVCHDVLEGIRKNGVFTLEEQLKQVNDQLEDVNEQLYATNNALETSTTSLINARAECQFVENNRLYKVAFAIPSVRARGAHAFNYVKRNASRFQPDLVWRGNVPYIRRGRVEAVRAILS